MATVDANLALTMGLTSSEYERILELLGRTPTSTELGMFAVMWSEHCGYKYSRPVLRAFRRYRESLEGGGLENAGVVPLGDGLGVVMKIESHNHPSAVEPFQGAATGVGGIIRDILTMGARPIALLDSLRFGPLREGEGIDEPTARRNRYLFERVVEGIASYGNCVGVPTVAGEVAFHPRFSANPLVNAMCVGIVPLDRVATAAAAGPGNPVLYLGSQTGRDGIHGATFASEALGEESEAKRPNVQIGDPFAGKLLIEATLEALATGAIVAIQDMGAAGLTCSTTEMSAKGGVGMRIDLDRVPARQPGMSAYELMLSESQERMLAVVARGREEEVRAIFHRWGLEAEVIGEVTGDGILVVTREGREEVRLRPEFVTGACPTYETEARAPAYHREALIFDVDAVPAVEPREALLRLLASPELGGKRWVWEQFDYQVQTQTVVGPGSGDAAVLAPRGTEKGLAVKIDGNGRWTYWDPFVGGMAAVCEAARNVACVGGRPAAITDGLNFGSPQRPEVYWQFREAVLGIAEAAEAIGAPVISGNVSFYNETDLGEVLPTPMIGMLGILPRADRAVGMGLPGREVGLALVGYWVACRQQGLGASAYLAEVHGIENGVPERPNPYAERRLVEFLVRGIEEGWILAAHDVSDGGLAVTLAEMVIAGEAGAVVDLGSVTLIEPERLDGRLFGEIPGKVVIAYDGPERRLREAAAESGLLAEVMGRTVPGGADLVLRGFGPEVKLTRDEMQRAYETALPAALDLD